MNDVSSSLLQISPPHLEQSDDPSADYGRLSFVPASQAQIIRSHQRDTSQVARLTDLVSEVLRSIAGTRWLGQKQAVIDLLVKAVYLTLTLGAGSQTLGEEYTDIMPIAARRRQRPTVKRRLTTIIMLLLPSAISTPQMTGFLRQRHGQTAEDPWLRLASILDSRAWKVCSNLHIIAFMFSGRFFEFGRRLGGLQYVSMLPRRPEGQEAPTYQPLGLLMLLPLLFKLLQSRRSIDAHPSGQSLPPQISMPESALSETLDADISPSTDYDLKNTYLTDDAISLPERQCTLCLESRGTGEGSGGTVAVTECGHVFCWGCLGGLEKVSDWDLEETDDCQAECPLCRQSLRMERLIAAYNL